MNSVTSISLMTTRTLKIVILPNELTDILGSESSDVRASRVLLDVNWQTFPSGRENLDHGRTQRSVGFDVEGCHAIHGYFFQSFRDQNFRGVAHLLRARKEKSVSISKVRLRNSRERAKRKITRLRVSGGVRRGTRFRRLLRAFRDFLGIEKVGRILYFIAWKCLRFIF